MNPLRPLALLCLLLLGLARAAGTDCPSCVYVGRAQITLENNLNFVADLTLTPNPPNGNTISYDLRALIRPTSAGAEFFKTRVRPRVPEFVYTQKEAAYFDADVGRLGGTAITQFPVVGSDDNNIIAPRSSRGVNFVKLFSIDTDTKISADGTTLQGGDEDSGMKMTFTLRRLPAPPTVPATAAPDCPTCAWSGKVTAVSRLGTTVGAALALTPDPAPGAAGQGSRIRYRVSGTLNVPAKVPQQEPTRKDCRTTYTTPFTLDAEQYVEMDSARGTYRGVITAQAGLTTRCDNKTLPSTDELVLLMTVSKDGVDRPLTGGQIGGSVKLAKVGSTFTFTRLQAGQAPALPATAPAAPTSTACTTCRWVGTASGKTGQFGVPYTAAITLTPGRKLSDNLQSYSADITLTLKGVGTEIDDCRAVPKSTTIRFTPDSGGLMNLKDQTAALSLAGMVPVKVTCTGLMAAALASIGQDSVDLIPQGVGSGLSLTENGTRFKGRDENRTWDLKMVR